MCRKNIQSTLVNNSVIGKTRYTSIVQSKGFTLDHPLVFVKDSAIHGKGLFAKKPIKEGEIIGEIKGKPTKKDGPYVLWIEDENYDGIKVKNIFKYINHNQKPNAVYYDDLTVVALRDIEKGEEITHHYGDTWEDDE